MSKVDCYKCKWSKPIPGSEHLQCVNPRLSVDSNHILTVKISSYGFKRGWANFPYDFDPIWIESCDGFESKEE